MKITHTELWNISDKLKDIELACQRAQESITDNMEAKNTNDIDYYNSIIHNLTNSISDILNSYD